MNIKKELVQQIHSIIAAARVWSADTKKQPYEDPTIDILLCTDKKLCNGKNYIA